MHRRENLQGWIGRQHSTCFAASYQFIIWAKALLNARAQTTINQVFADTFDAKKCLIPESSAVFACIMGIFGTRVYSVPLALLFAL
jgi:hypothetical protein